jgi:hypothetical protein
MRLAGASLVVVALLFAAALTAATGNRVQNPGAESGAGATDSQTIVDVPGWETEESFTAVAYGTSGFPAAGSGKNFFAGGPNQAVSHASQVVDLSDRLASIADGRLQATLSALLGGWEGQGDAATVSVTFLDTGGAPISTATIGPVTAADRGGRSVLLGRSKTVGVPTRAGAARVTIAATRQAGVYNDGYADDVSLTLEERSAPTPPRERYAFRFRLKAEAAKGAKTLLPSYIQTFAGGDGSIALHPIEADGHFVVQHEFLHFADQRAVIDVLDFDGAEGAAFGVPGTAYAFSAKVRTSSLRRCKSGAPARLDLYDAPRGKPDAVSIRFCGEAIVYVNGKPDPNDRVSVSVRR